MWIHKKPDFKKGDMLFIFYLLLTAVKAICNQNFIDAKSGYLKSPDYPSFYPKSTSCAYAIKVPDGATAMLEFVEFEVIGGEMPACNGDYVRVITGCKESKREVSTFCSKTSEPRFLPHAVYSHDECINLLFKSNGDGYRGVGFSARYKTLNNSHDPSGKWCASTKRLGGEINSGTIHSPNGYSSHNETGKCSWRIDIPSGKQLVLNFMVFNLLKKRNPCESSENDYLEIQSDTRYVYCGDFIPHNRIFHSMKYVQITFHHNVEDEKRESEFAVGYLLSETGSSPTQWIAIPLSIIIAVCFCNTRFHGKARALWKKVKLCKKTPPRREERVGLPVPITNQFENTAFSNQEPSGIAPKPDLFVIPMHPEQHGTLPPPFYEVNDPPPAYDSIMRPLDQENETIKNRTASASDENV